MMTVIVGKPHPFQRSLQKRDPKLALLRRADTERDTAYSIGGGKKRTKSAFFDPKPITLPKLKCLEKPLEEDD